MADVRLNSLHLEMPRRLEYRRAREALLQARGPQTLAGELREAPGRPATAIEAPHDSLPEGVQLWLVDRDFVYPLQIGLNTLGRSPDNDIILPSGYISRRHCTILVHTDQRVELFDMASKNGTHVNGQRVSGSACLLAGDEIRLCDLHLVFMTRGQEAEGPHTATLAD